MHEVFVEKRNRAIIYVTASQTLRLWSPPHPTPSTRSFIVLALITVVDVADSLWLCFVLPFTFIYLFFNFISTPPSALSYACYVYMFTVEEFHTPLRWVDCSYNSGLDGLTAADNSGCWFYATLQRVMHYASCSKANLFYFCNRPGTTYLCTNMLYACMYTHDMHVCVPTLPTVVQHSYLRLCHHFKPNI